MTTKTITPKALNRHFQIERILETSSGVWTYQVSPNNHASVWSYRDPKGRLHHEVEAKGPRSWDVPAKAFAAH